MYGGYSSTSPALDARLRGALTLNDTALSAGDGAASEEALLTLTATDQAEVLVFDLPSGRWHPTAPRSNACGRDACRDAVDRHLLA